MKAYKFDVCGNIAEVLHSGEKELVCCDHPMKQTVENTVDAAKEKQFPVIEKAPGGFKIKVGSAAHPMEEKNFIEWIQIFAMSQTYRPFLNPGQTPEATFTNAYERSRYT